jgi:hypothetical protein
MILRRITSVKLPAIDPATILYAENFGLKSSATTGSITAGTSQVTVPSSVGFSVGDTGIMESDFTTLFNGRLQGNRGTKGPDGAHPNLSYTNLAAMQADTSKADNLRAWIESTGKVYKSTAGVWSRVSSTITYSGQTFETDYYDDMAMPKALRFKILSITGNVWTISRSSQVTVSNANIYFDNAYIISRLCMRMDEANNLNGYRLYTEIDTSGISETMKTVLLPAGRFACGELMCVQRIDMILKGAGIGQTILFSPRGCASFNILATQCHRAIIRDLTMIGNAKLNGFNSYQENWFPDTSGLSLGQDEAIGDRHLYPEGFIFSGTDAAKAINVEMIDMFWATMGSRDNCSNLYRKNVIIRRSEPIMTYIQWHGQDANSPDGAFVDCIFDSDYLHTAFESFGTSGTLFLRCISRNGVFSSNTADNCKLYQCTININGSRPGWFSVLTPCVQFNSNIGNGATTVGGEVIDLTINILNYTDGSGNQIKGVLVGNNNTKVKIRNLIYNGLPYVNGAEMGPQALLSNSPDLDVDGVTATGDQVSDKSFYKSNVAMEGGSLKNCHAPDTYVDPAVVLGTGNIGTVTVI